MSDIREDFEEAAARLGYNLTMRDADSEDGGYCYIGTQDAWDMWQECCALKGKSDPIGVIRHNTNPVSDSPDAYVEWLFGGDVHNIAEGTKLYTQPQSAVPAGWKLMPIEATEEMISAGEGVSNAFRADIMRFYLAMIAVAPQPQEKLAPETNTEL